MNKYATTIGIRAPVWRGGAARFARAPRRWFLVPIIAVIAFVLLYVVVVNHTASQGYRTRELERTIETLMNETEKLELQVAELQSMDSIGTRLAGKEFVPVAHVQYIRAGAPSVALR